MNRRMVMIMAILWIAGFADAKDVRWKDLGEYLKSRNVTVMDGKGFVYSGRFEWTTTDALVIEAGYEVKVPRGSIVSITRYGTRASRADAFFSHMIDFAFRAGTLAIVTVPVGLVVFLGGLPVCELLDTIERRDSGIVTIKVLPDSQ